MAQPDLPSSMKAQVITAFNTPYTLITTPLPSLDSPSSSPHDLLIKVSAASYCHTDAVLAAGQMPPYPLSFPHIGCHEFAGTVISSSPNSPEFPPGTRVGVPGRSFHPCGHCFECSTAPDSANPDSDPPGYSVYCPVSINNGISGPGGFREYAVVDARQVTPIPDGLTAVDTAVLMCAGVTVYAALRRCGLEKRRRVAIMGCGGGLGHLGLQFAAKMGYKVIGVDVKDEPLALARDIAKTATETRIVDARVEEAADLVAQLGEEDQKTHRGDMGVDAVIILPESQRAFDYGVALLRNHGKCVVVSFPEKGFHVSARDVVFRDISVAGSLVGSNKVLGEMLAFAAEHGVRARIKTFSLARLNHLVEEYHKGEGGKLVVDMELED
ncbi:chaperonin 10-like protein [Bombardia bombarda]|uniref:Chaperonin 10-like protein n=1 Tax=Bombardia bombarda TaxID=252184 RepID=A0AA40C8S2_9PEZI|nr:chaperonin 10-like protein [Bombardia bombarda]